MKDFAILQAVTLMRDRRIALLDKGNEFLVVECPACPQHRGVGGTIAELRVVIKNQSFDDIAWTFIGNCILQQHVLDLFLREGLTGFTTRSVHWRLKSKALAPPKGDLHELIVTGWGGFALPESGAKLKDIWPCCRQVSYNGVDHPAEVADPAQWDGSDFFMVWPMVKAIFVSPKVREVLRMSGFNGYELAPPVIQPLSFGCYRPGRLSDYFPLERAKELAKGQDIV